MKKDYITPIFAALVILAIAGILLVKPNKEAVTEIVKPSEINEKIDLVKGNPDADVVVYEYSDMECPFCKKFHITMNKLSDDMKGKFAWVYRHLPLDSLHSKARQEAVAVTCVSTLLNPQKGFEYLNRIIDVTPSNNNLDLNILPKVASEMGIDENKFKECLTSKEVQTIVETNAKEAVSLGARGTPFSVIYRRSDGKSEIVSGALDYETMKAKLEAFINK